MAAKPKFEDIVDHVKVWIIPPSASLESPVRAKGIWQQLRTHLPIQLRKSLQLVAGRLEMRMGAGSGEDFARASAIIEAKLATMDGRLVLPREIEDILSIKPGERRRWLSDGRLHSAGTKTVKLRGRAKITFHVFQPAHVLEIRDEGLVEAWREDDAEVAAEKRRRAAWARAQNKTNKTSSVDAGSSKDISKRDRPNLKGWAEFERDGPL
jgi:hypothetical protein